MDRKPIPKHVSGKTERKEGEREHTQREGRNSTKVTSGVAEHKSVKNVI